MSASELPDLVDGLTAAEQRVLSGLTSSYRRSDRIVDGDRALYDTLVRMVRRFSTRYPLVEGQGNFGNIDGYSAADMEYTEARRSPIAADVACFPNVLVNGAPGIPPHNLSEIVAATVAYVDVPAIDASDLLAHIAGPDFPTGGVVIDRATCRAAYETGHGVVEVRGRTHVEQNPAGPSIVVTEVPFGVQKGGSDGLIGRIVAGMRSGVLGEIRNLSDQSDRNGIRLVLTLGVDSDVRETMERLYEHTPLQSSLGMRIAGLLDGVAQNFTLRDVIGQWVQSRLRTRSRRSVRRELLAVAERHGDERRTTIST
jgi:DNA gyrase subunit A